MPLLLSKMLKYSCLVSTAGNVGVGRFELLAQVGLDQCPKGGKYLAHFTCLLWAKFMNSDGCLSFKCVASDTIRDNTFVCNDELLKRYLRIKKGVVRLW